MSKRSSDSKAPKNKRVCEELSPDELMLRLGAIIDQPTRSDVVLRERLAAQLSSVVDAFDSSTADEAKQALHSQALALLDRYDAMEHAEMDRKMREAEEKRKKAAEAARAAAEEKRTREALEEKRAADAHAAKANKRTAALVAELDKHKTREEAMLAQHKLFSLLLGVEELWEELENNAEREDASAEVTAAYEAAQAACNRFDALNLE